VPEVKLTISDNAYRALKSLAAGYGASLSGVVNSYGLNLIIDGDVKVPSDNLTMELPFNKEAKSIKKEF
jgi:hypothetical protein